MWLLFRVAIFLLSLFVLALILTSSTVLAGQRGDACATLAYAILAAAWGFVAEYAIAGRRGWYLATVLPITVVLRFVLWILAALVVDIGAIELPGIASNRVADIVVTSVALGLTLEIAAILRRNRSHPEEQYRSTLLGRRSGDGVRSRKVERP